MKIVTQSLYESRMYWIHDPALPTSRRPNLEFAGTPAPAIAKEFPGALSTQPKHKKSRRRRRRKATRTANQNAARRSAAPVTPDDRWTNSNSASQRATRPKSAANDLPKMRSTPVEHHKRFHSSHLTQPPLPAANENSELSFGLDRCEFSGLYKPAQINPRSIQVLARDFVESLWHVSRTHQPPTSASSSSQPSSSSASSSSSSSSHSSHTTTPSLLSNTIFPPLPSASSSSTSSSSTSMAPPPSASTTTLTVSSHTKLNPLQTPQAPNLKHFHYPSHPSHHHQLYLLLHLHLPTTHITTSTASSLSQPPLITIPPSASHSTHSSLPSSQPPSTSAASSSTHKHKHSKHKHKHKHRDTTAPKTHRERTPTC